MLYSFDDYVLDTERRELRRLAGRIDIEPQVFDLLEHLIRTRDRVSSRDDLLAAVWDGRIVSESTLSSRINAARAAIGDNGATQRLIRTLPRKGIRFVGEVQEDLAPALAAPRGAGVSALPAARTGPSIAVLPFSNMSGDPESDYFADGMAEEIITALSRCGGLMVIARNSSFIYKGRYVDVRQVGRELGVGYVLEGSVRRSDERLRITAQLIEAATGAHLWAERYDGSLSDVFDLQDRIAENTAAIIEPRLRFNEVERVRRMPTESLEAYDFWLRAVAHFGAFTADSVAAAQVCLEKALAIDPAFALAMASSAYYSSQSHLQGWLYQTDHVRTRALAFARKSVELARDDPNVLWQSGFAVWSFEHDGTKALELLGRSLQINPNSAAALAMTGWVEAANGNSSQGRALLERSLRLSPRHPRGWFQFAGMAIACYMDGKFDECIGWAEKALVQHRQFVVALRTLAAALVNVGRIERARAVLAEALDIEPEMTVANLRQRMPVDGRPILENYVNALRQAGLPE